MAEGPRNGPHVCGIDAAHRKVHAEVPPRVEYFLTDHGRTLKQLLGPLGGLGTERMRREGHEAVEVAAPVAG
ncbi:winged helix-turn-helix transcriptional regulator [Streptomyces goshikiensis]|uniref:winged helix-turn-helix transcriptional regulator n=1 Tax=Streptomyces goshikiensis TaxID=1942 RepID=UPI00367A9095